MPCDPEVGEWPAGVIESHTQSCREGWRCTDPPYTKKIPIPGFGHLGHTRPMTTRNTIAIFAGLAAQDLMQVASGVLDYTWWECILSAAVACVILLLVVRPPLANPTCKR